jgi:pimeloyl-ACP methyl ester carboxylesterase
MKAKKILKVIGRILLILLLLVILLLICTSAVYHIKLHKTEQTLKDAGYYHPVSVGDHSLNMYSCGNPNGQHTIVALAGWGDGEMFLGWRQMTAEAEQDNRFVFLDRAGYGLSDDSKQDMTPAQVVDDYRTALQNAGIKAPYLLMGHSLGGLYATYWESKYPDEIEAVVFVDGTFCFEIPEDEQLGAGMAAALMPAAEKLGLAPLLIRSEYGRFLNTLPEVQKEQAIYLMSRTLGASAVTNEIGKVNWDCDNVWKAMQPTEIPKLYIEATLAYRTKDDFIQDGCTADSLLNVYVDPAMKGADDDAIYEAALQLIEQRRTEWAEPYYEKLGSCEVAMLPGDHVIFLDKPQECSRIIMDFLAALNCAPDTHISE